MDTEKKTYTFSDYMAVSIGFILFCIIQITAAKFFLKCAWDPLLTIYTPIIVGFIVVAVFSGVYDMLSEKKKQPVAKRKRRKK